MAPEAPLPRAFYERPTTLVARELLGKVLVRRFADGTALRARIVEVEAYLGVKDQASHARRGPTPRSAIMFGPPGRLYVYLIYGLYRGRAYAARAAAGGVGRGRAGSGRQLVSEPARRPGMPADVRSVRLAQCRGGAVGAW